MGHTNSLPNMRQAKRMFLIPEDVYQQAFLQKPNGNGSPMEQVRARMRQIQNSKGGDDVRAARFQQEYKRMKKLAQEEEERPLDVRLHNLQEIAEALPIPQQNAPSRPINKKMRRGLRPSLNKVKSQKMQKTKNNGEEEEEKWEDAATTAIASTSATTTTPLKMNANKNNTHKESKKIDAHMIIDYIRRNARQLGISEDGRHVLRPNGQTPYRTSNISEIVAHLMDRERRSQFRNPPTGYKEFIGRANADPFLQQHLLNGQSGSGLIAFNKTHKKIKPKPMVSFKPTLW